jgi:hypothetical protein
VWVYRELNWKFRFPSLHFFSWRNRIWKAQRRSIFRNFAGIQETPVFEACGAGEWVYVRFVLKKP